MVEKSWPDPGNSLALGLQRGVNNISLHPVTCSVLWVRCLFDRFLTSDFGVKWPLKLKFSKMSFRIHRRDTEIRFAAKFGENRPLRSYQRSSGLPHKKTQAPRNLSQPLFCRKWADRHKIPWTLFLTCPSIPNLVRIGCVLPDLFRKDWFFGPKSQYNIGF